MLTVTTGPLGDFRSRDLLPEGAVAGGDERVFAGVPAQKMRRVHMLGVGVSTDPYFVKQEASRHVDGTVKIEREAAFLFSGWADQGAKFRFEQGFLAFAGPQDDHACDRFFGQLSAGRCFSAPFRPCGLPGLRFSLGHCGGDCSAKCFWRKQYVKSPLTDVRRGPVEILRSAQDDGSRRCG